MMSIYRAAFHFIDFQYFDEDAVTHIMPFQPLENERPRMELSGKIIILGHVHCIVNRLVHRP